MCLWNGLTVWLRITREVLEWNGLAAPAGTFWRANLHCGLTA